MNGTECFSPGEYLTEELKSRNWTVIDLCEAANNVVRLTPDDVKKIIAGQMPITLTIANLLAAAFDQNAKTWLTLQATYDEKTRAHSERAVIE